MAETDKWLLLDINLVICTKQMRRMQSMNRR
jgi:hypothetical protein